MKRLILLLNSRLLLFLLFQLLFAFILGSFEQSVAWWLPAASLTNLVSILLLVKFLRDDKQSYIGLFFISRTTWKKDLPLFLILMLVSVPLVFGPTVLLSQWLWGDPEAASLLLFRELPPAVIWLMLLVFPVSIAFAELATYFGYILPRLRDRLKRRWLAVALPVLFLSLQHITLPFIPDWKFILYRGLVFLPFSLLLGVTLDRKPGLFPYFAIFHGLMDAGTVVMLLMANV